MDLAIAPHESWPAPDRTGGADRTAGPGGQRSLPGFSGRAADRGRFRRTKDCRGGRTLAADSTTSRMTMRLLESIIEANQRAVASNAKATLTVSGFADALPLVALTCIDPRLNRFVPEMLGVSEEQFIWLRNAGNIITGPLSSTMRSLALACAVKGGREIAVIGHTDCQVCQTTVMKLTEGFRALGVDRSKLPENLNEYFGLFASERQNVIRGAELVRQSPIIGSNVPVHGLVMDIQTGRLEW